MCMFLRYCFDFPYFHSSTPLTAEEHAGIVAKVRTEKVIEAHSSDESLDDNPLQQPPTASEGVADGPEELGVVDCSHVRAKDERFQA